MTEEASDDNTRCKHSLQRHNEDLGQVLLLGNIIMMIILMITIAIIMIEMMPTTLNIDNILIAEQLCKSNFSNLSDLAAHCRGCTGDQFSSHMLDCQQYGFFCKM